MPDSASQPRNRRRIFITALIALGIGLIASVLLRPIILRELAFQHLFSEDAGQRDEAVNYFLHLIPNNNNKSNMVSETVPFLENDQPTAQRIIKRLTVLTDSTSEIAQPIFHDVFRVLNESQWWKPDRIPVNLWKYRINHLLDSSTKDSARLALHQLVIWESHHRNPSDHCDFDQIWLRLINYSNDSALRLDTLFSSLKYLNPTALRNIGIFANALHDSDPRLRRTAWITIGLINPETGYAADWSNEPDPAVVETMLWAAQQTNPDQPGPLIHAVEMTPWKTTILPWLLAKSPNEESLRILQGLHTDGNPAAAIPLLMRLGNNAPLTPSPTVAAYLGLKSPESNDNPVLMRWYRWRTVPPYSWNRKQFLNWIPYPEAEDGSVWAAVLLAYRLLPEEQSRNLSTEWLSSLDTTEQCAGLLLAGLLNIHHDEINAILQSPNTSRDPHRYAAASQMIIKYRNNNNPHADESVPTEILTARRLISPALVGKDLDILTALLAVHDDWAVRQILNNPEVHPTDRLIRFQWLIETFLPEEYEKVAPLDPWNERVARLQCDIMTIADILNQNNLAGTKNNN